MSHIDFLISCVEINYECHKLKLLPARVSEQGNVIGSVRIYIYIYIYMCVCTKKNCN